MGIKNTPVNNINQPSEYTLTLNNAHPPEVAYNYLDNALPEGEARMLLSEHLGVSEKNVYSPVRAIGNDLVGAISFAANEQESGISPEASEPQFRVIKPEEMTM